MYIRVRIRPCTVLAAGCRAFVFIFVYSRVSRTDERSPAVSTTFDHSRRAILIY